MNQDYQENQETPENINNQDNGVIEIPDTQTLKVLYTSDIKGNTDNISYLATIIKQKIADTNFSILVDSGNWAKGTMLADHFKGMPMVEILNYLSYDAVGIGEGEIAFGSQNLYNIAGEAKFPLLCANLVESGTGIPPYFLDKKFVIKEKGPFIVGITAIANPQVYPGTGIEAKDPFAILPDVFNEMQKHNPDVIILLSRLGTERDKAIARAFPQISLIVGAGEEPLESPIREGNTFIVRPGDNGRFLGAIDFDMEAVIKISQAQ
ncbi:MAG: hypothetical protein LWY06_00530 [Firmicutes bacterium]|nr:hypothetical protein [Bacillota bacterium]